MGDAKVGDL